MPPNQPALPDPEKDLEWLEYASELLDSKFRLPGTKIRFGLDALIGLIPYAGDVTTFIFSIYLVTVMYRKGLSGELALKMFGNLLIDVVVGVIPVIGDLFDIGYKANLKNVSLMKAYYAENKHSGSGRGTLLVFVLALIVLFYVSYLLIKNLILWIFL